MSDRKANLKLQLPSHHLYDIEKEWSDAFEPPTSTYQIGPIVVQQQPRRKLSKSSSSRDASSNAAQFNNNSIDINAMLPDTPPTTPDSNAKLYPFLRLHRQASTSVPDVTKSANIDEENVQQQSSVSFQSPAVTNSSYDHQEQRNGMFEIGQSNKSQQQPPQLRKSATHGSALSDAVKGHGLTAASSTTTSMDALNNNNYYPLAKSATNHEMMIESSERSEHQHHSQFQQHPHHHHHHNQESMAKPLKRPSLSSGFLTSLIFGNKMFDGKPLKVSDFDMSMVAPGSM
jgi:hypothetical protein